MKLKSFLLALLAQLFSLTAMAYDAEIDGIYYNFSGTRAIVVPGDNPYSGAVTIPSSVSYNGKTYDVTEIGAIAFYYSNISSISIPESVTTIGREAFERTPWYENQPEGLVYAGKVAYKYKGTMPENTTIEIQEGTLGIASYAFYGCSGLTSIIIPESVKSVGELAFGFTAWFDNQPDGLVYAGKVAYRYIGRIPENTSIEIKEGTLEIAESAFYSSGLTSIIIPASVISVRNGAFNGCDGLTSIVVEEGNSVYDSRNNCNALIETATNTLMVGCGNTVIPNGVISIRDGAFYGRYRLTSITIPESVKNIGFEAFARCDGLTSIVVEDGNTIYDSRDNCNALLETATNTLILGCNNTIIPESVTSIGEYAFNRCYGMTSITIPDNVISIGKWAFNGCSELATINFSDNVASIGENAFINSAWLLNQPDGLVYAGKVAYKYKGTMPENTSINLQEGTLGIAEGAFSGCSGLISIGIPESVTNIGSYAFYKCENLTSVVIPENADIGIGAFEFCSSVWHCMEYIKLPVRVASIGDCAFLYTTIRNVINYAKSPFPKIRNYHPIHD